eukprot:2030521-Pleurochrysis_carterae.AAC.1
MHVLGPRLDEILHKLGREIVLHSEVAQREPASALRNPHNSARPTTAQLGPINTGYLAPSPVRVPAGNESNKVRPFVR